MLARAPFAATATLLRTHELTVYELTTFLDQNYAVLKHDAVLFPHRQADRHAQPCVFFAQRFTAQHALLVGRAR